MPASGRRAEVDEGIEFLGREEGDDHSPRRARPTAGEHLLQGRDEPRQPDSTGRNGLRGLTEELWLEADTGASATTTCFRKSLDQNSEAAGKLCKKTLKSMGFARKVANRVIFMDKAEIVEDAATDAFLGAPRSMRGHHGRAAPSAD